MAIGCTYCGGEHATPADVRACWQRTQGGPTLFDSPADGESEPIPESWSDADWQPASPEPPAATVPARTGAGATSTGANRSVAPGARRGPAGSGASRSLPRQAASAPPRQRPPRQRFENAGPDELARGIVVPPGAEVPPPWLGAERVVVDATVLADPDRTIAELFAGAAANRRVVFELVVPFADAPRSTSTEPPYALGPKFWFGLDVLHHLVWSNSIDATGPEPGWHVADAAAALGARLVSTGEGDGDIELPDGTRAWIDGGPPRRTQPIAGLAVLPAVSIEHGSLVPPLEHPAPPQQLAADQLAAVTHPGAAARIVAPAGSGKTRVLTERARHLLHAWRVPPAALSLVAFNKRAQEEMQARTTDLRGLQVRTLNAIALAIVNGSGPFHPQPRSLRTIDEPQVRDMIGRLVQFPRKRNTDPVAAWIEALSVVRLGLQQPTHVEAMYGGDVDGLAAMWPAYRAALQRDGVLDFDEQVYRAIELLLGDADVRAAAQRACRLLLVDEFQDLTPAHVLLVRLLSAPSFGVFGVGDDDQTIYGFSGADPAWLIEFGELFPGAAAHPLEVNYRCPGDVVAAADRLVRHNRRRVAKVIRAARPAAAGLRIVTAASTLDATVAAVREAIADGRPASDIAVLTRVNSLLAPVQVALSVAGVGASGGVGAEFMQRTAVRSALAWLRLSVSSADALSSGDVAEALRRPSRPMHPNVATWVGEQRSLAGLRRLAGRVNNERDASRIASFADDIAKLQQLALRGSATDVLRALADDVGLGAAIATLDDGRRGMNRTAQNDDLVALTQLAELHPAPGDFDHWLRGHLGTPRSGDGVTLATVHRVKGQEWPAVVLHHCEVDQYPHRLAEDLEEERRVFHVAITRGAASVTVVVGDDPSPFVEEMQNEPPARIASAAEPSSSNRSGAGGGARRSAAVGAGDAGPFEKGSVLAAVGLTLVDGGQEWVIESLGDGEVVARLGSATRRFAAGAAVNTAGRQRGPLRLPADGSPPPESIRALDLLRQARERLRNGKPAYVVFHDATLERIALALPASAAALRRIDGIGPAKLEQYGDAILLAVEDATAS